MGLSTDAFGSAPQDMETYLARKLVILCPLYITRGFDLDKNEHKRFKDYVANYAQNFMLTFFDYRKLAGEKYFIKSMDQVGMWRPDARLFLDSGAYSAFTQGDILSLDEYMAFLEVYEDQFWQYANMDNKADQKETYENLQTLRRNGFNPSPVWHAIGGPALYLEEYLQDKSVRLVCIGSIAKETITDKFTFRRLDEVFSLVAKHKKPIHAFGKSDPEMLIKYPFATADSSTWYCARHGAVLKWNPLDRTIRQIRFKNSKLMEREFGPRAKVLLGQVHDGYTVPHYYIATEHNFQQLLLMQNDLETFWTNRGVIWDYEAIDQSWRGNVDPAVRERCMKLREKTGNLMPGDDGYVAGMHVGKDTEPRLRTKRKWDFNPERKEVECTTPD